MIGTSFPTSGKSFYANNFITRYSSVGLSNDDDDDDGTTAGRLYNGKGYVDNIFAWKNDEMLLLKYRFYSCSHISIQTSFLMNFYLINLFVS